jgi:hypothetical protein
MAAHTKRLPAWLVGLFLAIALAVMVIVALRLFGYGDDPVVDPDALAALLR